MSLAMNFAPSRIVAPSACVLLLLFAALGCDQGPQTFPVQGTVLVDGEPLSQGSIQFVSDSGRPSGGKVAEDGTFQVVSLPAGGGGNKIVGLVPGRYRISVKATERLSEAEDAEVRWLIPRHYADARTSGLVEDIDGPTEGLVVKLTTGNSSDANTAQKEAGTEGENQ